MRYPSPIAGSRIEGNAAQRLVRQRIRLLADALLRHGTLSGEEIVAVGCKTLSSSRR